MFPQTKAKELLDVMPSKELEEISKHGCLAFCYLYCMGIGGDDLNMIKYVATALKKGAYSYRDGVLAEPFFGLFSGRKVKVIKKDEPIDITTIEEATPVFYSVDGKSGHWVVIQNGKIVFNSLANSRNVNEGKPIKARIIKLA